MQLKTKNKNLDYYLEKQVVGIDRTVQCVAINKYCTVVVGMEGLERRDGNYRFWTEL